MPPSQATRRTRWLRFTVRTLLLGVLVAAAFFAGVRWGMMIKQEEANQTRLIADWRRSHDVASWGTRRGSIPWRFRWEIEFPSGLEFGEYASFLDQFKIELGVVRSHGMVTYTSGFTSAAPGSRTGPLADEHRVYFSSEPGEWHDADVSMLKGAEAPIGPFVMWFLDDDLEQRLLAIEHQFVNQQGPGYPSRIRKTRFAVRRAASQFELYVAGQEWFAADSGY